MLEMVVIIVGIGYIFVKQNGGCFVEILKSTPLSWLILGLHPTNERRRYKITPSLIGCEPRISPVTALHMGSGGVIIGIKRSTLVVTIASRKWIWSGGIPMPDTPRPSPNRPISKKLGLKTVLIVSFRST